MRPVINLWEPQFDKYKWTKLKFDRCPCLAGTLAHELVHTGTAPGVEKRQTEVGECICRGGDVFQPANVVPA
jgi:hypothetical protein